MPTANPKNILIAPLDWGLGHTTRCIPIIRHLLSKGFSVLAAGNQWQRDYLRKTFDNIETVHLDGYDVTYGKRKSAMLAIALQTPRLFATVKKEHMWLSDLVKTHKVSGVISDNRYGLHHPQIPSVIITHQPEIQTGLGSIANNTLRALHYRYLQRFSEVWIPDVAGTPNLSGSLGHPAILPAGARYIGPLSQFAGCSTQSGESILIVLSGPEPQRTILSRILWRQAMHYNNHITFVAGSDVPAPAFIPPHITYHNRLTGIKLLPLLQQAGIVICRSGYSSIMDLVKLNKKAILIPTPGQAEQEYLAKHLQQQGMFLAFAQQRFDLQNALAAASNSQPAEWNMETAFHLHRKVIDDWVMHL